jgi:hypothetical protein
VPELVSGFTADHEALKQKMHAFSADGNTALQDAIDRGLGLLLGREGRLAIVALTDGAENNSSKFSGAEGQGRLLQAAKDASVTVCCIGLGGDVETAYLSRYQATGGWYLFAPDAGALQRTFSTLADYLAKEWQFQYRSPFQATDGTRRAISATLEVSGQATPVAPLRYVAPGLLPNVRSVHAPFLALLLGLLALPALARTLSQGIGLLRFRARRVQRLGPQSPLLGRQDPNGHAFGAGDWVVSCPKCQRAHWVRSWRHNRCRCMVEPEGQACFCFASLLPGWSRRALHRLSGHSLRPGAGQVWMCKCAGDKEGY